MTQSQIEKTSQLQQVATHQSPITSITDQLNKIELAKKKASEAKKKEATLNLTQSKEVIVNLPPKTSRGEVTDREMNFTNQLVNEIEVEVTYNKNTTENLLKPKPLPQYIESKVDFAPDHRTPPTKMEKIEKIIQERMVDIPQQFKIPRLYYLTQLSKALKSGDKENPYYSHFQHNIQSIQYISTLQPLEEDDFIEKKSTSHQKGTKK